MHFKSPDLLLFLLLVPVAIGAYIWLEQRRSRKAGAWSSRALLPNMVSGAPGQLRLVPAVLFGLALILLLVGFSRPEWKFTQAKNGATVVLLVDTSGSMGANDVQPTRLLAADAALTAFVKAMPSTYRASLVTFANGAAVRVSPTYDRAAIVKGLPRKPELEGTGVGDAISQALRVAQKAVGTSKPGAPHPPATILLVSDGGQNAGRLTPAAAAAAAKKAGVPISTVLVGTPDGKVEQQVPIDGSKKTYPLVQQVPADPTILQQVAKASGGTFYQAQSASGLTNVYTTLGKHLVYVKQFREVTEIVAGIAFILMLSGVILSAVWFRRLI